MDGIKGPSESHKPEPVPLVSPDSEREKLLKAMETPVSNLGQLKKVLVDNLGEQKGLKLYNHFVRGLVMAMLSQIRQTSQSADQATKKMGQNQ